MINENIAHRYCKDDISKIENYDKAFADTTQTWDLHHRTEIWWNCSAKELIENDCYYHRKACELIFLTKAEHCRLHMKGKYYSEATRKKMSEANKGKYKGRTLSIETRKKIAESLKGKHLSEATKMKIHEAAMRRKAKKTKGGTDDTVRVG